MRKPAQTKAERPPVSPGSTEGLPKPASRKASRPGNFKLQSPQELKVNSLIESLEMGLIIVNREARVLALNGKARKMLKRIRMSLHEGDILLEKLPDHRKKNTLENISKVLEGKEVHYNILYPKGTWLLVSMLPMKAPGNETEALTIHFRDLTLYQKEEEKNRFLALLAEFGHQGIIIMDSRHRILWANEIFLKQTGYSASEVIGKQPEKLLAGFASDQDKVKQIDELVRKGLPYNGELLAYRKDGQTMWLQVHFHPVQDPQGNAYLYFIRQEDITRQKEDQMQIELLSLVAKETNNSVMLFNVSKQRVDWVNEGFTRLTGFTLEDFQQSQTSIFSDGSDTDKKALQFIEDNIRLRQDFSCDLRLNIRSGQIRWHHLEGKSLGKRAGKDELYLIMGTDISDMKGLEEERVKAELKQQKKIIHAVLKSKEEERRKIGAELHDNINQMLAAIKLQLSYGISHYENSREKLEEVIPYVQDVIDEIRRLSHQLVMPRFQETRLSDEIMRLTHLPGLPQLIDVDLVQLQEELLSFELKETLYRVVQEQLTNIQKHASAAEIRIRLFTENQEACLDIFDNGIGFDVRKARKGIGLMNIQNRVDMLNGQFDLESAPGKGCRLKIRVPIRPETIL